MKKLLVFFVLFSILVTCSFAETLYGASVNIARLYEQFPKENTGRDLNGTSFYIVLNHFPEDSALGWYIRTSIGGYGSGYEWKEGHKMENTHVNNSMDLRLSVGPSYAVRAGSMITIPISLGPVFTNYREGSSGFFWADTGFFETLNMGLLLDGAIIINPSKRFAIINGITVNWDFLSWQKGNATFTYREIDNARFKYVNYNAFKIGYYFGLGMRFDNSDN